MSVGVLSLDLSCTGTGIVLLDGAGQIVRTAQVGYPLKSDVRLKDRTERLIAISEDVQSIARDMPKGTPIVIERYAYNEKGKQNDLAEVHAVVRADLHRAGFCDVEYVVATSARARVLGKGWGKSSKKLVEIELKSRGYEFETDDMMDAFVNGRAALNIPVKANG